MPRFTLNTSHDWLWMKHFWWCFTCSLIILLLWRYYNIYNFLLKSFIITLLLHLLHSSVIIIEFLGGVSFWKMNRAYPKIYATLRHWTIPLIQLPLLIYSLNFHLSNEGLKINQIFDSLKKLPHEDLIIQVEVFEKGQSEDETESGTQYDMTSLVDAFQAVCMKNQSSVHNVDKFLDLLQVLYHIEDNSGGKVKSEKIWQDLNNAAWEIVFVKGLWNFYAFKWFL